MSNHSQEEKGIAAPATPALATARHRVGAFLESKITHALILFLIGLDALCVIIELGWHVTNPRCDGHNHGPLWVEGLGHFSFALSCLFVCEIPAALFAFGPAYYGLAKPRYVFHIFDALVVVVTVVLEIVLRGMEEELASLLVLLRLWRIVKLVEGVAVGIGEWDAEAINKLERAKETIAQLEAKNAELSAALDSSQREADTLRQRVGWSTEGQAGTESVLGLVQSRSLPDLGPTGG